MHPEAVLLVRLQRGDEQALDELYTCLGGRIYALALKMLGNREEAEELLQDTFVKLCRSADYDPERASARAYVYTVARNGALSRLRGRRARPLKADAWDVHDPTAPFRAEAHNTDDRLLVAKVLQHLTDEDRRLVHYAFFWGYSHRELAELTGLPLGTIKSRIRRALAALRQHLGET